MAGKTAVRTPRPARELQPRREAVPAAACRRAIMDRAAAAVPDPEELVARTDAWFGRHPVLGGALFVAVFAGLVPAAAALGLLS